MAGSPRELQPHRAAPPPSLHIVKFYDPQAFPATEIADYFLAGLDAGESSFVIATAEHCAQIKQSLSHRGLDAEVLARMGMLFCEDAEPMLESLRARTGMRERELNTVLKGVIYSALTLAPNGKVRVYGELVNLMAVDGDYPSCIRLEREWHRLVAELKFSLYCAYSNAGFDEESAGDLCEICDAHDQVRMDSGGCGTNAWLKVLQQRSQALQMAIAERKATEHDLRLWETTCANLLEVVAERWNERFRPEETGETVGQSLSLDLGLDQKSAGESLNAATKSGLQEILQACTDACEERRWAEPGSEDWYKSTGKIVAYGKLTSILQKLLERLNDIRQD